MCLIATPNELGRLYIYVCMFMHVNVIKIEKVSNLRVSGGAGGLGGRGRENVRKYSCEKKEKKTGHLETPFSFEYTSDSRFPNTWHSSKQWANLAPKCQQSVQLQMDSSLDQKFAGWRHQQRHSLSSSSSCFKSGLNYLLSLYFCTSWVSTCHWQKERRWNTPKTQPPENWSRSPRFSVFKVHDSLH